MKSLRGTQTEHNLMNSFVNECQARNRYVFYGQVAEEAGYPLVKKTLERLATQEQMHARIFFEILAQQFNGEEIEIKADYPINFYSKDLVKNLEASVNCELHEHHEVYPAFAQQAREEGFPLIAKKYELLAEVEKAHSHILDTIAQDIKNDAVFKKDKEMKWVCQACGHFEIKFAAPKECPFCENSQNMFNPVKLS